MIPKNLVMMVNRFQLFAVLSSLVWLATAVRASEEAHFHCGHCAMLARIEAGKETKTSNRKYAPDRLVDILHLKIEVTPDFKERDLEATVTIDFKPIAKPLRQLHLHAVDLRIHEVTSNQAIAAHQTTDHHLELTFAEAIPADEQRQVIIRYQATPKDGLFFRTGDMGYPGGDTQLWTQGEPESHRHWFPSHDYPNEKFTTELVCHVPQDMIALSNGRLVAESVNDETGLKTFHWLQDQPHVNYLVSLLAGYFYKLEDTHGDLPIALYVPPSEKDQAANTFIDTKKILEFFDEEIGVPFPWDKYYNVCALDYHFGGMENTSITTLTTRTLFTSASENLHSSRALDAHEVAHQWFGDLVTCKDWSHIWLNEGFATYYSLLYDKHAMGNDFFKYGLYNKAQGIFGHDKDIIPIVYNAYNAPIDQFSFRAYPKGGWVLHMLRSQLGDNLFRQCVKAYLEKHRYQSVVTQDLVDVFEELSGRSLSQFFDQWVYLSGYPSLNVSYHWDELTKQAKLTVNQTQMTNEKRPWFRFPLPVRFHIGEESRDEEIIISKDREDYYFTLSKAPNVVRIDPEMTVLAKVNFTPNEKMLLAQSQPGIDMIGRLEAAKKLGEKKGKSALTRLKEMLNSDPFFAVRTAAANGLAGIRSPEALEALQASLNQEDARVRQAVVRALTRFYGDDALNTLKNIADHEANPDIRAQAIRSLGKYARTDLRDDLLRTLQSQSYRNRVADAAIVAMRSQDDSYYVEPLLSRLKQDEARFTSGGFSNAMKTLGYLARNEESKDSVRQFLTEKTSHPKENVARSAMGALGELKDPKAIAILETFVAADADSKDGKAAQDAINQIRKEAKPHTPAELTHLRQQVSDLQKQLRTVTGDLKSMQDRLNAFLKPNTKTEAAK